MGKFENIGLVVGVQPSDGLQVMRGRHLRRLPVPRELGGEWHPLRHCQRHAQPEALLHCKSPRTPLPFWLRRRAGTPTTQRSLKTDAEKDCSLSRSRNISRRLLEIARNAAVSSAPCRGITSGRYFFVFSLFFFFVLFLGGAHSHLGSIVLRRDAGLPYRHCPVSFLQHRIRLGLGGLRECR